MTDRQKAGGIPEDARQHILCEMMKGRSVRQILREDEGMPARSVLYAELAEDREFADQYARAMEVRAETLFDEILDIADDGHNDWMERTFGEDTRWVENGEALRRSALRVDARKWALSKMQPKKYGDKIAIGGADGLPPLQVIDPKKMSDAALRELHAAMLANEETEDG